MIGALETEAAGNLTQRIEENEFSIAHNLRILSNYLVDDEKVLVITEADRSATTAILAREY